MRWTSLAAVENSTQSLSIFDPASPGAHSIVNLAILAFVVTGLIFVVVEGVLLLFGLAFSPVSGRAHGRATAGLRQHADRNRLDGRADADRVLSGACDHPHAVGSRNRSCHSPSQAINALFVTVIGHQWWWEYVYESYDGRPLGFITANELHMPVSDGDIARPVYLTLKSADVCHSFWVPRLAGKVDLIPVA